jgi:hypothetical protein
LTDGKLSCFLDRLIEDTAMTNRIDAEAECHPYRTLGLRFWLPWTLGLAVTVAAFLELKPIAGTLAQPLQAIVLGTGVICFTLALVGLCLLPRRVLEKRSLEDPMRPAAWRYTWRFLPLMLIYTVLFMLSVYYARHGHPTRAATFGLALAPALPVLFAIRAMLLLLKEETDEYLRTRALETWSLATGLALCICTVWGFLDQFEVAPHLPLWAAFPLWALCLVPAQFLVCRRAP